MAGKGHHLKNPVSRNHRIPPHMHLPFSVYWKTSSVRNREEIYLFLFEMEIIETRIKHQVAFTCGPISNPVPLILPDTEGKEPLTHSLSLSFNSKSKGPFFFPFNWPWWDETFLFTYLPIVPLFTFNGKVRTYVHAKTSRNWINIPWAKKGR